MTRDQTPSSPLPSRQPPPVRFTIVIFRGILWTLPAGFTVLSALAIGWLDHQFPFPLGIKSWLLLNAMFMLGTGWFDTRLSNSATSGAPEIRRRVIKFIILQLLLFALILTILVAVAFISWRKGNFRIGC